MKQKSDKSAFIIFAKYPHLGKVKTRLAKDTGDKFARFFYDKCATKLFGEVAKVTGESTDAFLFYTEEDDLKLIKDWVNRDFGYFPQKGDDLGSRISKAFKLVFEMGYDKVIIVGSDVPDLNFDFLKASIERLNDCDLVIGPCSDGGYNLLGIKKYQPDLFSQIPWSTDKVLETTLERGNKLGLITNLLHVITDIDTLTDLKTWLKQNEINKNSLKLELSSILGKMDKL